MAARFGRMMLCLALAGTIAACRDADGASVNTADNMTTDAMTSDEMAAPAKPEEVLLLAPTSQTMRITNNGSDTVMINRLVVNDLPRDDNCDVKVLRPIQPGTMLEVRPLMCGEVLHAEVTTANQTLKFDWTSGPQVKARRLLDADGLWRSLRLENIGSQAETVESIIANDRADSATCNVKFFKVLPAQSSHNFDLPDCGDLLTITVKTNLGEAKFDFRPANG